MYLLHVKIGLRCLCTWNYCNTQLEIYDLKIPTFKNGVLCTKKMTKYTYKILAKNKKQNMQNLFYLWN